MKHKGPTPKREAEPEVKVPSIAMRHVDKVVASLEHRFYGVSPDKPEPVVLSTNGSPVACLGSGDQASEWAKDGKDFCGRCRRWIKLETQHDKNNLARPAVLRFHWR